MKKVENKKVSLVQIGKETDYRGLISDVVKSSVPAGGMGYEDIKKRLRIEDAATTETDGFLSFEDADFSSLQEMASGSKWIVHDQEILNFLDYIKDGGHKEL